MLGMRQIPTSQNPWQPHRPTRWFTYSSSDPYSVHLDWLTLKIYMIVLWGVCSVVPMVCRP